MNRKQVEQALEHYWNRNEGDKEEMCTLTIEHTKRSDVLGTALKATTQQRNKSYGEPFDNMTAQAELKQWYRKWAGDKYCAQHDESFEMVLCKIARIACGQPGHTDNYVDGAAYLAIAAECQSFKTAMDELNEFGTVTDEPTST